MEYGRIIVHNCKGTWFESLEGRSILAVLEWSTFNGTKVLFAARPIKLPDNLKKYKKGSIHPKYILLT